MADPNAPLGPRELREILREQERRLRWGWLWWLFVAIASGSIFLFLKGWW